MRSEVGGTLKLESDLDRQKPHFSDEIEKQSIMQKVNSVNGKPHYKTFNPGTCNALSLFLCILSGAVCKMQWP